MSSSAAGSSDSDAPRFALAWAILVCVVLTLVLGYPALVGKFLVTIVSDQYKGGFPVREFAALSLKDGLGIPKWNPYIFGGMPYVAAMGVGDIYYPTAILRMLLPVDIAMTLGLMIHVVLAGVFMYVFCRGVGLSFRASLIGGAAYMMGGPIAGLVSPGHDGKLFVSALTPAALHLLRLGVREGTIWAWGGLAIVTGLAVLSPHPQLLQYMLLLLGFYGLYLAFGAWDGKVLDRKVAAQRLGMALGAVGLGFLIGAVQYAPFIEYIPWSPRSGGTPYEFVTSFSMPPEELLNSVLPEFSGILFSYWGRNGIHFHSDYFGVAVIILAAASAFATGKSMAMSRSFRLFFLGVAVVSLLWALGGFTPFYRLVYYLVPGTKYFRAPSTMMQVTMFAVAVFAAIGAESVLAGWFSRRFIVASAVVAGILTVLALTGGLTNFGAVIMAGGADRVFANRGAVAIGGIRMLLFVLLTLGVLWGINRGALRGRVGGLALLLVVCADLWSIERKYWNFSDRASVLYKSDATIDYLAPRRDSARVLTLGYRGADVMLNEDGLMHHRIRQITGYHSNEIGNFVKLGGREDYWRLGQRGMEWKQLYLNPSIRSLFNVRYLMSDIGPDTAFLNMFGAGTTLVAGPARNAEGEMVYLYQLPGDNPPAWVATATLKAPDDAALATIQDQRFNPTVQRSVAILDTTSRTPATAGTTMPPASSISTQVSRPTHSRIVVDLSAPAQNGNMLIVSENFYPGWMARVDGKSATVERADFTLIGVPLAAGARKVELEFTSASSAKGTLITWASSTLAAVIMIWGLILGVRRRSPAAAGA